MKLGPPEARLEAAAEGVGVAVAVKDLKLMLQAHTSSFYEGIDETLPARLAESVQLYMDIHLRLESFE